MHGASNAVDRRLSKMARDQPFDAAEVPDWRGNTAACCAPCISSEVIEAGHVAHTGIAAAPCLQLSLRVRGQRLRRSCAFRPSGNRKTTLAYIHSSSQDDAFREAFSSCFQC